MNATIISDNLAVSVGVYYSKYVKFQHPKKAVCLSETLWSEVEANLQLIDEHLEATTNYELKLSDTKLLKVGTFRTAHYVTLCERFEKKGEHHTKCLSISKQDWQSLKTHLPMIRTLLNYDIAHGFADEDDVCTMLCVPNSSVEKRRLVPRMCSSTYILHVYAFLMQTVIKATIEKECVGCFDGSTDDSHHTNGCRPLDWRATVKSKFNGARQAIAVYAEESLKHINSVLGWDMPTDVQPDNAKLYEAILEPLDTCEACAELLPLYWSTFETLITQFTTPKSE